VRRPEQQAAGVAWRGVRRAARGAESSRSKPVATLYRIKMRYVVYKVTHSSQPSGVWKYGITSQSSWEERAKVGKRECNTQLKVKNCGIKLLTRVTGYGYARIIEYIFLDESCP
jgi:hypothetical protein